MNLFEKIKSKHSGVAALEASLTLPVLMIVIFFIIEFMRINNIRTSMDTLALKGTLFFTEYGDIDKFTSTRRNSKYVDIPGFPDIIAKHKPLGISTDKIKYYFSVYESLETMCSAAPYGNEEVYWPANNAYSAKGNTFIDSDRDSKFLSRGSNNSSGNIVLTKQSDPQTTTSINSTANITGKIFVLTFVCEYKFSSPMIEKIFAGGSNTKLCFKNIPENSIIQKFLAPKIMLALETVGKFFGVPENARATNVKDLQSQIDSLNEQLSNIQNDSTCQHAAQDCQHLPTIGVYGDHKKMACKKFQECFDQMNNLKAQIASLESQIAELEAAEKAAAEKVNAEYDSAKQNSTGKAGKFLIYGRGVGVCE